MAASSNCILLVEPGPLSSEDAEALAVVRRDLVVLPTYAGGPLTSFPVGPRTVMTAAHGINLQPIISVGGVPMTHLCAYRNRDLISGARDMADMHSTIDRFEPNIIDPHVELKRGDRVFLAGFYGEKKPYDSVGLLSRTAKIVVGRVLTASRGPDAGLVQIEVPLRNYRGMSGGPAAIVDDDGMVRVWGVAIRGGLVWDPHDLVFRSVATAARIPEARLSHCRRTKLMHPSEVNSSEPIPPNAIHHSWGVDPMPGGAKGVENMPAGTE